MNSFVNDCGSPACIAGWTLALATDEELSSVDDICRMSAAQLLLGLNSSNGRSLLAPNKQNEGWDYAAKPGQPHYITAHHAVATLRHLAATSEVDWHRYAPVSGGDGIRGMEPSV